MSRVVSICCNFHEITASDNHTVLQHYFQILQFGNNFPWSADNYNPSLGTVTKYKEDFRDWVRADNVKDEYGQAVLFDHAVGMTGYVNIFFLAHQIDIAAVSTHVR